MLGPILYNVHTNDIPISYETRTLVYSNNRVVAAQGRSFPELKEKVKKGLERLSEYYKISHDYWRTKV